MPLTIQLALIDERFREVRTLLSHIKAQESMDTPPIDPEEVKIVRGLFYVHLYGALEQSLNEVTESFLRSVSALGLKNLDLSLRFLPTAMNAQFKSLSDSQSQKRWQKRLDFVNSIHDGDLCRIETSVFAPQFQNSETNTIVEIATYLGINSDVIKNNPDHLYVDEVVQKRHQIAHGRVSPAIVGARGRSTDLELRLDGVRRTVELYIGLLERHFDSYEFLNTHGKIQFAATDAP